MSSTVVAVVKERPLVTPPFPGLSKIGHLTVFFYLLLWRETLGTLGLFSAKPSPILDNPGFLSLERLR
jgi:hypothetical protein